MTRLILIRHGQSQANTLSVFAGHTDSPLTELGMEQAERTAAYVAENYEIAAVYSSDLCRASAVGEKVAEKAFERTRKTCFSSLLLQAVPKPHLSGTNMVISHAL